MVYKALGHADGKVRAIIIRNHRVVAVGSNIHEARTILERHLKNEQKY